MNIIKLNNNNFELSICNCIFNLSLDEFGNRLHLYKNSDLCELNLVLLPNSNNFFEFEIDSEQSYINITDFTLNSLDKIIDSLDQHKIRLKFTAFHNFNAKNFKYNIYTVDYNTKMYNDFIYSQALLNPEFSIQEKINILNGNYELYDYCIIEAFINIDNNEIREKILKSYWNNNLSMFRKSLKNRGIYKNNIKNMMKNQDIFNKLNLN